MSYFSCLPFVFSFAWLVGCSGGSEPSSGNEAGNSDAGNGADNIELISTATLVNSGADVEVPALVSRASFTKVLEQAVGVSPDGTELAIAASNRLDVGYEAIVTIYDTGTGALKRELTQTLEEVGFANRMGGGFSRPELVLWSEDDTLTVLFGAVMVGYSIQAQTGELLATQAEVEANICSVQDTDIDLFDPRNNRLFCIGVDRDDGLLVVDTRSLTYSSVVVAKVDQEMLGVVLSHDGSELALSYGRRGCFASCEILSVQFLDSITLQPTREDDETNSAYALLGEGYDVVGASLKTNTGIISIDRFDGHYLESNLTRDIAAMDQPYGDTGVSAVPRFRLFSLPYGRVIGDIPLYTRYEYPERILFSNDGRVAVHVGGVAADVYSTTQRSAYTVLNEE